MLKRYSIDQVAIVMFTLAVICVNALANLLPINDITTGEVSDSINIFFVPAGYVFSIWGLIYLGLLGFAFYQFSPSGNGSSWLTSIYAWFYISCIANIVWIFLWHYQQIVLSVLAMLVLLVSLIIIYSKLEIGKVNISGKTFWLVHIPFSIYLGWISVATIANISGGLYVVGWGGLGIAGSTWAVIMILVATLLSLLMLFKRNDYAFSAVIIWAILGIGIKFPEQQDISIVVGLSLVLIVVSIIFNAWKVYRVRRFSK